MEDFERKTVLVTGAAGNLGSKVAEAFFDAGANLIGTDYQSGRLEKIFHRHLDSPALLLADGVNTNDPDPVKKIVENAIDRFGRLDILVNTVGGYRAGTAVHDTPVETWDFMMNLNARPAFVISRAVIPQMLKQGSGAIIHFGARPALTGRANMAAYSASKSAVIRLVESMAVEYKDKGIRVNCIIPGTIDTPKNRESMPEADFSKWVQPQSIAAVILFLASERGRDISGVVLPVLGGS